MKKYIVYHRAFVAVEVMAADENEAERIALESPLSDWKVSSLSEEYRPIVEDAE